MKTGVLQPNAQSLPQTAKYAFNNFNGLGIWVSLQLGGIGQEIVARKPFHTASVKSGHSLPTSARRLCYGNSGFTLVRRYRSLILPGTSRRLTPGRE